ncbi:aspartate--tRNA ligase [Candidatus Bandiella euplotis]|uniref:Aspartate--tRNA(Asp/Asn) ligase n=1 Tax=Candidatus Bandiella euplotis TaxID=1664265 RepID=A0ABZ0UM18_9RICK|nr:aspartate--tRNA ligase [Candidatus Bandiella woodruffii]WPX96557.1 Aspartate--tRNA ligase [Candidatus Bandiella woodruffii]
MHKFRTHKCGQLSTQDIGSTVKVSGWIHRKRDHGGVYFIDLRDHFGIVQLVTSNQDDRLYPLPKEDFNTLTSLSYESVITVVGKVVKRSEETINKELPTGEVEIVIEQFNIESEAEVLPINVNSDQPFPEDLRLRYRFLDLRRENMHNNIALRSKVARFLRDEMYKRGFTEFQTPILTASSPEGARDFLVPSRLHPGKFYALPQAPQQFKQLFMIAGFDRYFQIAPCFRDEDARADRAPGEFYQLDIEMSFVTQEDVFEAIGPVLANTFKTFSDWKVTDYPFPQITYHDAMLKYGSDKPDLRNPIVIRDATEVFRHSDFSIFNAGIENGSVVRAIPVHNCKGLSRGFYDKMIAFAQAELKAKGLAYIAIDENGEGKGPIAKFLSPDKFKLLKEICDLKQDDSVFFTCDVEEIAAKNAGKVREKLGQELNLVAEKEFRFCWIVDYPFYEWNAEEKKLDFFHNPFSMPQGGLEALQNAKTLEEKLMIKAFQYDIICNGVELSSGAIRNHKLPIMYQAFANVGYSNTQVDENFPAMVKALKYGAPPHGGIAPGVDRMIMLLANEPNIREIIAFPLNQNAQDLLMGAPTNVDQKALRELNIMMAPKPDRN